MALSITDKEVYGRSKICETHAKYENKIFELFQIFLLHLFFFFFEK